MREENNIEIINLNKFTEFLDITYKTELLDAAKNKAKYISVSFKKIIEHDLDLGDYILSDIESACTLLGMAATKVVGDYDWGNTPKVRLTDFNINSLQKDIWKLRSEEVDKFVILKGFIRRIAEVLHYIDFVRIKCVDCDEIYTVRMKEFYVDPTKGKKCPKCGGKLIIFYRELRDLQRLVVEEDPMYIKPPQKPRSIMIELHDDLCREDIDKSLQLSKTVIVSGVVKDKRIKPNSVECLKYIDANMINVVEENIMNMKLLDSEIKEFQDFSKTEDMMEVLAQSVVPNIHGHDNAKIAILLMLAGGVALYKDGLLEERGLIHILLVGNPGGGKCLEKGTKILMFDGSIKKVENVIVGDLLMGDDSTPRKVLSLSSGIDQMYKAIPTKGKPFSFNKEHILTLIKSGKNNIEDISIKDYLNLNPSLKERYKLFKVPVEFPKKEIDLLFSPYLLGVWLGGHLNENKHIPDDYKINSREIRLELLAGLIDTNGYYHHNCYEIVTKYPQLRDDILFLCRSVGLVANSIEKKAIKSINFEGIYQRIHIYGDLSMVPCKVKRKQGHKRLQIKDPLVTGFKIEPDGIGEYFGFETDGNRRYLLEDFTVVHNSVLLKRAVMFMPGSIFTSGKGVSGVGLVASVSKDEQLGGWVCDAGAVPRASGALLALDECDKISKEDIAHLNNAMVDTCVRVDKAGIHVQLQTMTSILAAANPINRVFDKSEPVWKQIGLPKDFVDRFDLVFPIQSGITEKEQRDVADLVVGKYRQDSTIAKPIKPHLWVMKYLSYAKQYEPKITEDVHKCLVDNFINISRPADKQEDSAYFSYRLLTNIIRLTQAVAKLRLKTDCGVEDAVIAINLLLSSLKAQDIITKDGLMDYFRAEAIIPKKKRDIFKVVKKLIETVCNENSDNLADGMTLAEKAAEYEIEPDELDEYLNQLKKQGDLFEPRPNKYKLI